MLCTLRVFSHFSPVIHPSKVLWIKIVWSWIGFGVWNQQLRLPKACSVVRGLYSVSGDGSVGIWVSGFWAAERSQQRLEKETRPGKKSQGNRMPSIEVPSASAPPGWGLWLSDMKGKRGARAATRKITEHTSVFAANGVSPVERNFLLNSIHPWGSPGVSKLALIEITNTRSLSENPRVDIWAGRSYCLHLPWGELWAGRVHLGEKGGTRAGSPLVWISHDKTWEMWWRMEGWSQA